MSDAGADGCVVVFDNPFRSLRGQARLSRLGARVLRPTAADLAAVSRYRPPNAHRVVWIAVHGCSVAEFIVRIASDDLLVRYIDAVFPMSSVSSVSFKAFDVRRGVGCCGCGEPNEDGAKDACSEIEAKGIDDARYNVVSSTTTAKNELLGCAAPDEAAVVAAVVDLLRKRLGVVRLQVLARASDRNAALLERIGNALAAAPHHIAFSKTAFDWWVSVVDDGSDTRNGLIIPSSQDKRVSTSVVSDSSELSSTPDVGSDSGRSGGLWFSVCSRGLLAPFSEAKRKQLGSDQEVCRAAWKLREAIQEREIAEVLSHRVGVARALDLGAAPGGWTSVLAERCVEVVAVDPADLDPAVGATRGVRHVRLQAEAAVAELLANGNAFDIIVTDMNSGGWGYDAAEMIARAVASGIAADGAALVMTLKGCEKASAAQLRKHIGACSKVLEAAGFVSVRCVHLMGNTPWERTLLAVWSGVTSRS